MGFWWRNSTQAQSQVRTWLNLGNYELLKMLEHKASSHHKMPDYKGSWKPAYENEFYSENSGKLWEEETF